MHVNFDVDITGSVFTKKLGGATDILGLLDENSATGENAYGFSEYFGNFFEVLETFDNTGLNSAEGTDGACVGPLPGLPDIVVTDDAFNPGTVTDFVVSCGILHDACCCALYSE